MKNQKGFIVNMLAIIAVFGIVFWSQTALYGHQTKLSLQWGDMKGWFAANVYPRAHGEVAAGVEKAKQGIIDEIKTFFVEKITNIFSK